MKVKCSACGAVHSLDALISNQSASEAVNAALLISGDLGVALIKYLGLFRPSKSSLTFDRVATLLNELTPMIQDQTISRDGKQYPAPPEAWIFAINQMLASRQSLKLPMKSHGYLLEIIAGFKPSSQAVAVLEPQTGALPIVQSKKLKAIKGALEWGMNG